MADALSASLDSLDVRDSDASLDLALVLSSLEATESQDAQEVADELQSLAAIYDDSAPSLSLYRPPRTPRTPSPPPIWTPSSSDPLRLVLSVTLAPPRESIPLHLLLSLPRGYPINEPPLIQLQDRYLSSFAVSDDLFGQVLRTFMHDHEAAPAVGAGGGAEWTGGVCLFEGIEYVRELCGEWVGEREAELQKGERARQAAEAESARTKRWSESAERGKDGHGEGRRANGSSAEPARAKKAAVACPEILSCEPIVDRQSVFVGHAAKVNSLEEVDAVMEALLSNNKIAKATHNISAYQFTTASGTRHADNDDDGETAAGSRLAHLLTLLDVPNVMVVVSRWYGGIHLGPDRFKLINQAARDALTDAGFLQEAEEKKGKGGGGAGKGASTKKR
ncbi:Protein IMPACT-like protein [Rhodotorula toruloides]|uniref:Ribosomal protein S5 domain 2-type fold n=1 Tax=Rhodotorula toruloides TaxID=5286 RepID=A0A2T0AHI0_RHOTO|nr:Protein IMPACT-like protein [Rhodotorula toruloides]PRQ77445.1 Ribosomal protein S5 domain 2-type fold [Rhodotorula toruloides]